ncbi:C40 family peptidase [Halalkalibacter krulwichiae]|uniref:Putative peptidoglycan endopeptidase LytE n=1 Tax=Halalkalibacter krulwichiae TaxID=199441 RepID=A0A1X9MGA4_9BACI|nr:peptidoglycan-binding protein [Halalkalibacter krulwichiae]ARK32478.1 putative peptidoglycan endopeptidase LytE precursor [Halalkalibacter krulwichiae]
MKEASTLRKVVISSTFATGIFLAAPQMADAALGDQTLRTGMSHPDVKELQDALKSKGHFNFERSTGYYGQITADAVRDFQRKNNLQVDGIAGPQTLSALLAKMGGQASSSSSSSSQASTSISSNLLRFGSSGRDVEQLQHKLKEQGYYKHSITGQYGRVTEAAVRDFQRAKGIQVDGIVGPQTLSQLLNEPLPSNNTVTTERNVTQTANTVVQAPASSNLLRVGNSGSAVRNLQSQLRSVGVFNQEPTGYFGEVTARAVREFQRIHNLSVDGVAGPQTMNKLSQVATNQSSSNNVSSSSSSSNQTAEPSRGTTNRAALMTNLVADGANYVGVPYLWGGQTPSGFDCSGLVQYLFKKQGVSIPRTVAQQWAAGTTVSQPAVGDLVFFETISKGPSHNGIYIGNGQFLHSGSSTGVTVASMNNSYWKSRYLGAKRL